MRGYMLYVEVLAHLQFRARTITQLRRAITPKVNRTSIERVVAHFVANDVAYVVSTTLVRGRATNVFGLHAEKAIPPARTLKVVNRAKDVSMQERFCLFWNALESPMSIAELMDESGMSVRSVRISLAALKEHELIRIGDYTRDGGTTHAKPTALYVRGKGPDKVRPVQTRAEYCRAERARRKVRRQFQLLTFQTPLRRAA